MSSFNSLVFSRSKIQIALIASFANYRNTPNQTHNTILRLITCKKIQCHITLPLTGASYQVERDCKHMLSVS